MTYRTMSDYMSSVFGGRVQKVAVNAGLGCPNRDGTISFGGCAYCDNAAFNPAYAFSSGMSVTDQLAAGIGFFQKKEPVNGYLAYFQSFSNTYGDTAKLIGLYEEGLAFPGVLGLVISTRPDCLSADLLDYFERRFGNKAGAGHPYLLVEIGVESTNDDTLKAINRGHDFKCAQDAIIGLDKRGVAVGAHIIIGLPGEEKVDFINHARRISALPVSTLKLHQLQIIKGTAFDRMYSENPDKFKLLTPESYAEIVVELLRELRADIALDRFVSESPRSMVVAPSWGIKPDEFSLILQRYAVAVS
ncbi:MAG: TIGR01212 family radical SAM protein [Bacteroidaceae bacterium]|nr:TIGR01212 family radical SAM protein [Bacteroidaceae bacterium]